MSQQLLHLLNGHSFVNCPGCQSAPEFVGVDFGNPQPSAQFPQANFHPADFQPVVGAEERDKEGGIVVGSAFQVVFQMDFCTRIKVHWALFAAFSKYYALPIFKVDVLPV